MKISENIRSLREKQGMSLEDVGRRISVSRATIMRYEKEGIKNIPYDKITLLADTFGCTPQYLMGWDDRFTDDTTDLMNDLLSDPSMTDHLKKFSQLRPEHKQTIYDMFSFWWEKENT